MMRRLLCLCLVLVSTAAIGAASPCSTATLATYDTSGFSCSLGLLTFSSFQFSAVGSVAPLPAVGNILVIPIDDLTATGLSFQGPLGAGAGLQVDVSIAFVITSSPAIISGDAVAIQGFGVSGGAAYR